MNANEDKTMLRLLMAKELYLHGLEHSTMNGLRDRMIAVHNLHASIELVLRTILIRYEICPGKEFEVRFSEIPEKIKNHKGSWKRGMNSLPRLSELKFLNNCRNEVQHYGQAPEIGKMAQFKDFATAFLTAIVKRYFDSLDFESLSRLDWIEDELLKEGLRLAEQDVEENNFKKSLLLSTIVFTWAARSVAAFLPDPSLRLDEALGAVKRIKEKSTKTKPDPPELAHLYLRVNAIDFCLSVLASEARAPLYYAAVLTSGVRLKDFRKFGLFTPEIAGSGRYPRWTSSVPFEDVKEADVRWVKDFVIDTILGWQSLGLQPRVPAQLRPEAEDILTNGDPTWKDYFEDL
jgi:hypothetical protein